MTVAIVTVFWIDAFPGYNLYHHKSFVAFVTKNFFEDNQISFFRIFSLNDYARWKNKTSAWTYIKGAQGLLTLSSFFLLLMGISLSVALKPNLE